MATDGDPFDSTLQLGKWSMVPAEDFAAYRQVEVEIVSASIVRENIVFRGRSWLTTKKISQIVTEQASLP